MDVVIPTYARRNMNLQTTWNHMTRAGIKPYMVVRPEEVEWWRNQYDSSRILVLPEAAKGIAPARDWIVHDSPLDRYVVMFDDDLNFSQALKALRV